MKKKIVFAFGGTLLLAAFAFNGISIKPASLHELTAKAGTVCKYSPGDICVSEFGILYDYIEE